MPVYDYRCRTCDSVFERRASFDHADDVTCPDGHTDVKRLLSAFAFAGRADPSTSSMSSGTAAASGGGCCGGGCGCG